MNILSNLTVRQKLLALGAALVLSVVLGITQYFNLINERDIAPAERTIQGVELNQELIGLQKKVGDFYLEVAKARAGNSGADYAGTGKAAFEGYSTFRQNLANAFGEDEAKSILSPLEGNMNLLEGAIQNPNSDDYNDAFAKTMQTFGPVAAGVGQRSDIFRSQDPGIPRAAGITYGSVMPLAADITSLMAYSMSSSSNGGLDDLDSDLGSDDLDAGMDDLGSSGAGADIKGELLTALTIKVQALELFGASIAESTNKSPFFASLQSGYELPTAGNFSGDLTEGEQLLSNTYDYARGVHKLIGDEAASAQSRAAAKRFTVLAIVIIVSLIVLAAVYFIANDILKGVDKALGVARAISREGDLSLGSRYSSKRSDELGELLDEMAHMCESLNNTATAAESIASGDLQSASIAPRSEQDRMGKALQNMVESLRGQIGETKSNAASVAETARNILAATSQVAATANQMATSISEATTTAEEVRQTANLAEQKAKSVAQSAGEAASVSVVGQRQTQMTLDEMDKIRNQMETIAESIVRLSEQGQAIGDIITTVNDIAEQSNVLAVNASIEAAKAGEHGRGFAVVAQEVKSLADESKTATSAIRAILSDIERATAAAVMLAEQGTKSAQASVDRSKEAGASIKDLGTRVVQAAQSSAQISASASQQLAGVDQVVDAMVSIKDGSSQIVDSVNMVKNAAEELSGLSSTLQKNIQTYKV